MNRKVVALVDDLFWRTKIDQAVRSAGASTAFSSEPGDLAAADASLTSLVLVDLALKIPPFDGISRFKSSESTRAIPVIGFYEHVRKDLKARAEAAGCDEALPRSTFSQKLADLVMKYALPGGVRTETEEAELPEE